jgi:hypothetical protein
MHSGYEQLTTHTGDAYNRKRHKEKEGSNFLSVSHCLIFSTLAAGVTMIGINIGAMSSPGVEEKPQTYLWIAGGVSIGVSIILCVINNMNICRNRK